MATFTLANDLQEDLGNGIHDFDTAQLAVALSNTAPASESSDPTADGNGILANVTEIAYTNLSTRNITTTSWSVSAGTGSLVLTDLTLTSSGGTTGPFRYVYIYNDTATGDPIVGYSDYGSSITLQDGETFKLNFGATTLTIAKA